MFRSVDDFASGRPAIWRQAFGTSATQLAVTSFGGFVEDRWQTSKLTLNLGARYDVEKLPTPFSTDKNNLSPRIGLAWSPIKEWAVRSGFGFFYDRLPLAFLNEAIQKDGVHAFEQVATDANAAAVFAATAGGKSTAPIAGIAPSIFRANPNFVTPYSLQANGGVERLVTKDITIRADYLFTRGLHLPNSQRQPLTARSVDAHECRFTRFSLADAAAIGKISVWSGENRSPLRRNLPTRRLGRVDLQRADTGGEQSDER